MQPIIGLIVFLKLWLVVLTHFVRINFSLFHIQILNLEYYKLIFIQKLSNANIL